MRSIFEMLRAERPARVFFLAHAQSSFGNGIGYVALIIVAYDRWPSPWGITLVLLADFVPGLFGAVFGAAADRWSRRTCAVVADLARAVAFIGISQVDGIGATVALALLAGVGTGLFFPAVLSGLPTLVSAARTAPAMSLYGILTELGSLLGSALAGLLLLLLNAETLLLIDGFSFAVSAALLATLPFAGPETDEDGEDRQQSLLAAAAVGMRAVRTLPGILTLILSNGAAFLFAGVLSVIELLYARSELHVGASGYSVLVALCGVGVVIGNAFGSKGGDVDELVRRYLLGLVLLAISLIGIALAPNFAVASVCFVTFGIGNGMILVFGRLVMQRTVPDTLIARVWGVRDAVTAAAIGTAFTVAGALATALGAREVLAIAGSAGVVVWFVAGRLLRHRLPADAAPAVLAAEP